VLVQDALEFFNQYIARGLYRRKVVSLTLAGKGDATFATTHTDGSLRGDSVGVGSPMADDAGDAGDATAAVGSPVAVGPPEPPSSPLAPVGSPASAPLAGGPKFEVRAALGTLVAVVAWVPSPSSIHTRTPPCTAPTSPVRTVRATLRATS
jgi:hypothetical protein